MNLMKNFTRWFFIGMGAVALIAVSPSCGPIRDGGGVEVRATSNTNNEASPGVVDPFGPPAPPETAPVAPETPPEASPPQPPPSAPEAPPAGNVSGAVLARQQLESLAVNDDFSGQPAYERNKFKHWSDLDKNGCSAREDVLIRQDLYGRPQVDPFGCKVVAGDWFSEYDGLTFEQPGDLDVDHMVPLAEGWRAGAWRWDASKREKFANDLDSRQLIAVSAASNRSKGDKRPDQWMPPRSEFRCQYLFDWVSVKSIWGLTVATPEKSFIGKELQTC